VPVNSRLPLGGLTVARVGLIGRSHLGSVSLGVSFPGMSGVLAFVGNFIPYVGSLISMVLPVLLALLELEPL
jgi:predicted PurR-regulated permease PerM